MIFIATNILKRPMLRFQPQHVWDQGKLKHAGKGKGTPGKAVRK